MSILTEDFDYEPPMHEAYSISIMWDEFGQSYIGESNRKAMERAIEYGPCSRNLEQIVRDVNEAYDWIPKITAKEARKSIFEPDDGRIVLCADFTAQPICLAARPVTLFRLVLSKS